MYFHYVLTVFYNEKPNHLNKNFEDKTQINHEYPLDGMIERIFLYNIKLVYSNGIVTSEKKCFLCH